MIESKLDYILVWTIITLMFVIWYYLRRLRKNKEYWQEIDEEYQNGTGNND